MESLPSRGDKAASRHGLAYQPALDGLRGVAVAAVVLYHAGFHWMAGWLAPRLMRTGSR